MTTEEARAEAELPVRGLHLNLGDAGHPGHGDVTALTRFIGDVLPAEGVNLLVAEIGYNYAYRSYPDVARDRALSAEDLSRIAEACGRAGIELVPQINCLGHQSWHGRSHGLLRAFPEFDETPWIPQDADSEVLYCRSYCPRHPRVHEVVFALIDELAEAAGARRFHVGMDEVFLIGEEGCPRCAGSDPARLFADEAIALHEHLAERGLEMWMWGDRLIEADQFGTGKWEGSTNGTWPAVDELPTDIVICDWHYERACATPRYFAEKGFGVVASPWRKTEVALEQLRMMRRLRQEADSARGMLQITWCGDGRFVRAYHGQMEEDAGAAPAEAAECFRTLFAALRAA
ncbi:MAG: family 20 glycosylhydrolase [Candidatus Brocadiia bacterium]